MTLASKVTSSKGVVCASEARCEEIRASGISFAVERSRLRHGTQCQRKKRKMADILTAASFCPKMRTLSTCSSWVWAAPGDGVHRPVSATATPVDSLKQAESVHRVDRRRAREKDGLLLTRRPAGESILLAAGAAKSRPPGQQRRRASASAHCVQSH